jgi:hypothetical protein
MTLQMHWLETEVSSMLSRDNLRSFIASLGPRMVTILNDHEKNECGEFIPHMFVGDFIRYAGSLQTLDSEILDLLAEIIRSFMRSQNEGIRDLLYASMFPQMQEYPSLLAAFLATGDKEVIDYYRNWLNL